MAGVLANISARNPEPRDVFAWGPRALGGRGANRRKDRGPKLVIEVGEPKRPRSPLSAPVAEESPPQVANDAVPVNVHTADTAPNAVASDGG